MFYVYALYAHYPVSSDILLCFNVYWYVRLKRVYIFKNRNKALKLCYTIFFLKVISVTKIRLQATQCIITFFTYALPQTCLRTWVCSRFLVYKVYILLKQTICDHC